MAMMIEAVTSERCRLFDGLAGAAGRRCAMRTAAPRQGRHRGRHSGGFDGGVATVRTPWSGPGTTLIDACTLCRSHSWDSRPRSSTAAVGNCKLRHRKAVCGSEVCALGTVNEIGLCADLQPPYAPSAPYDHRKSLAPTSERPTGRHQCSICTSDALSAHVRVCVMRTKCHTAH